MNHKKKVSVITDNPLIVFALRKILFREGFVIAETSSLKKALSLSSIQPAATIDLIILDIPQPSIGAFRILWCIKNYPEWQNTPVLMTTNSVGHDEILRGYNLKADYIVPKPFTDRQLCFGLSLLFEEEEPDEEKVFVIEDPESLAPWEYDSSVSLGSLS